MKGRRIARNLPFRENLTTFTSIAATVNAIIILSSRGLLRFSRRPSRQAGADCKVNARRRACATGITV